ncbi:hypothetical protein BGZ61DRAFT_445796 [Ilyonectria robusta]|uniref:uncharacterized protein n=1 Tax=Ilyonectria robusta TaxID=1079257 RepID=UPI001E8DFD16|nr:uncharacterized protein BGZ61DRAFT_445796 [Ilyonectria robusta]KAH8734091.1 hypothetical protein BGZ61DRAFT_445796 [Ilyonectria robusta]
MVKPLAKGILGTQFQAPDIEWSGYHGFLLNVLVLVSFIPETRLRCQFSSYHGFK